MPKSLLSTYRGREVTEKWKHVYPSKLIVYQFYTNEMCTFKLLKKNYCKQKDKPTAGKQSVRRANWKVIFNDNPEFKANEVNLNTQKPACFCKHLYITYQGQRTKKIDKKEKENRIDSSCQAMKSMCLHAQFCQTRSVNAHSYASTLTAKQNRNKKKHSLAFNSVGTLRHSSPGAGSLWQVSNVIFWFTLQMFNLIFLCLAKNSTRQTAFNAHYKQWYKCHTKVFQTFFPLVLRKSFLVVI